MNCRENIGVPADSMQIEVDGVRLAVAREGHGPAVVCLHAIGHGGGDFEAFTSAVKDRFEVIRLDWPGQGRSGPDRKPLSPAHYAQLLHGVLEKLHIERPIIIGNSIGGAAAIIYAHQYPVHALVLCDSGGLVPVGTMARLFCSVFARFFAAGERRAWWYKSVFRIYYKYAVLPSEAAAEQRQRIIDAEEELAPVLREAWFGFGKPEADIRNIATSLDIPIWVAWAEKDRVIPLSVCMTCIRQMKAAYVTTFDAGHAAFLEQPEEFTREFLKFVGTVESAAEPRLRLALQA